MDKKVVKLANYKGGSSMSTILKGNPIKATPIIKGSFAREIIREANRQPSQVAIKRNKLASDLVKKLKS